MPSIFLLLIAFQIALVRGEPNIQVGEKRKRQGLRDWTSNARSDQGERWRDSQRFQCNTDRGNRGETGEKPLGEHIIWPLPSSGAVANRRGWVPTISVTLEVSWRKATLINLSPRLRWMIASSSAQNNPPLLKPSTPQPAPPPAHTNLPPSIFMHSPPLPSHHCSVVLLIILFILCRRPSSSSSCSSYALKSLWSSGYKQWINPSPPCVNGLLNISLCLQPCQQHLY